MWGTASAIRSIAEGNRTAVRDNETALRQLLMAARKRGYFLGVWRVSDEISHLMVTQCQPNGRSQKAAFFTTYSTQQGGHLVLAPVCPLDETRPGQLFVELSVANELLTAAIEVFGQPTSAA